MRNMLLRSTLLKELLCISLKSSLFWSSIQIRRSKGFLKHINQIHQKGSLPVVEHFRESSGLVVGFCPAVNVLRNLREHLMGRSRRWKGGLSWESPSRNDLGDSSGYKDLT